MPSANFTIRNAVPLDRPTLVRFMASLQDFERSLYPNRSDGWAIASGHLGYLEQLVKTRQGRVFVAENLDGLLGFLVCFVDSEDEGDLHVIDTDRKFGCITDLYVLADERRRGVGNALIQSAENHFKSIGLSKVRITVLHQNEGAKTLYERAGYKPYEVTFERSL